MRFINSAILNSKLDVLLRHPLGDSSQASLIPSTEEAREIQRQSINPKTRPKVETESSKVAVYQNVQASSRYVAFGGSCHFFR